MGKTQSVNEKVASVLLDVITGQADDKTILAAARIQREHPETWRANQWLRMVGGTAQGKMDKDWADYLRREIDDEFEE